MLALTTIASAAFSLRGPAPTIVRHVSTASVVGAGHSMSAYDYNARGLRTGNTVDLKEFEGKVSLVVNVASK